MSNWELVVLTDNDTVPSNIDPLTTLFVCYDFQAKLSLKKQGYQTLTPDDLGLPLFETYDAIYESYSPNHGVERQHQKMGLDLSIPRIADTVANFLNLAGEISAPALYVWDITRSMLADKMYNKLIIQLNDNELKAILQHQEGFNYA
jgi:Zn-dependent protease with chaperone function